MKIRWTQNSIRFRITPSELAALKNGDAIGEVLSLPGGIIWSTRIEPESTLTRLDYTGGVLRLHLHRSDLAQLLAPDAEGVYFSNAEVRYFIEKDFPCVHPRASEAAEAETETFSAPAGFEERKNS